MAAQARRSAGPGPRDPDVLHDVQAGARRTTTIQVCPNLSCALAGAENILKLLTEKLGIGPGETTPDGAITLVTAECLGNCDHAPCLQVDGVDRGPVTREAVAALVEELKAHV